ncbi:MAG: hypothetical protein HY914_18750 [Desulfomonile tiedjei]|nr:hypothetical protein [Desulfomonile tiedjei]
MKPSLVPVACLVLLAILSFGPAAWRPDFALAQEAPKATTEAQAPQAPKPEEGRADPPPRTPAREEVEAIVLDGDLVAGPRSLPAPNDPCLPSLYRDWHEAALDCKGEAQERGFARLRIVLDRSVFRMSVEGLRKDGEAELIYESPIGIGDLHTPTPEGDYLINHIYPYPDVLYFSEAGDRISGLYKGFFAPLLVCDDSGDCRRHRDLGMHGFDVSAFPDSRAVRHESEGPVSAGCIRIPDPCAFKATLIRLVGVGPLRRNDRGSYHWLDKPVKVVVRGDYPGTGSTLASIVEEGLIQVHNGLKGLLGIFGP